jgi:hypothetical protein
LIGDDHMKRRSFLHLLCLSILVLQIGWRDAICEFPPDLAGEHFEEDAYQHCRQNRPNWTDEQCRDFVHSVREILEGAPFVITREQIEPVSESIRDGWLIVPGVLAGEPEEFELEKAAWKRRLTEVGFVKWQRAPEERAKALLQWESVIDYQIAGMMKPLPEVPDTFIRAYRLNKLSMGELMVDDPFDWLFLRSLSDEEMTYVWTEVAKGVQAMAEASRARPRQRLLELIEVWNEAYSTGDMDRMFQAHRELAKEVYEITQLLKHEKATSLFVGLTRPAKSAEYIELIRKVKMKVANELEAEIQQFVAEFREKVGTEEKQPVPKDAPREEAGTENKHPRRLDEQEINQPAAAAQMTRKAAGGGKPVPPVQEEKQERSGWLVPVVCVLVVLGSVGLIALSARKKNT